MTKQYIVTEAILRKADKQVTREFGGDCGLFHNDGSPARNYQPALDKLNLMIAHLQAEIARNQSEVNAKGAVFLAYRNEAIRNNKTPKAIRLIEIAFNLLVSEAKEEVKTIPSHRDTRPWWQQQDERQGA